MALGSHRSMSQLAKGVSFGLGMLVAATASSAVTEPNGLAVPIPQEQSGDYFDAARYNVSTLGIQTLLDTWEGATAGVPRPIDAYADASSTNVVFSPLCGLEGTMILRGGACMVDFGWYCTSDPPGAEVIYPLITQADIATYHDVTLATLAGKPPGLNSWNDLKNNDKGFVPTIQAGILKPLTGSASLSAVRDTDAFKACTSQQIGFAFKGNPASLCPMSKFSEPSRNQVSTFGTPPSPWIGAVVYESKKYPGTFYIAFEDLPTTPASFTPALSEVKSTYPGMRTVSNSSGWESYKNDGDFNDFVFKVSGLQCEGGGKPCVPVGADGQPLKGACSIGVTACAAAPGAAPACTQKIQPTDETCDGWDNDCDGVADDGDGLCQPGFVCDNGNCVGSCGSPEFPCTTPGTVCETTGKLTNFCVEGACKGVVCPEGQRCSAGACVGGCEGVTCPANQECIAGTCLDLCAGVSCPTNFVCERGACIPNCSCLPCTDPAKSYCNSDGHCIDPACANVVCLAKQTCQGGICVDPCAVTPNPCGTGTCTTQENGTYTCTGSAGGGAGTGGDGGIGVSTGTSPGIGVAGATGSSILLSDPNAGCGCRVAGSSQSKSQTVWLTLLGLAVAALRFRRRAA